MKTKEGSICDQNEPQKYQNEKRSLPKGQGTFKTHKSSPDTPDLSQTGSWQFALQSKISGENHARRKNYLLRYRKWYQLEMRRDERGDIDEQKL